MDRETFLTRISMGILAIVLGVLGIVVAVFWGLSIQGKTMCGFDEMRSGDKCIVTRGGESETRSYDEQKATGPAEPVLIGAIAGFVVFGGAIWILTTIRGKNPQPSAANVTPTPLDYYNMQRYGIALPHQPAPPAETPPPGQWRAEQR
ncbi:hypothetical protein H0264_01950 [Nocardia huaxiensis]|uniref:Uncharacterized protein n=1 Tax=Nocardia huaxiensis TaxID=2755382 RepID=A0A7D6ZDK0_9NOCA|nr:hypothetical protein [Nocardia huaxiensis]QLY31178.1 hypothetical protein H0264_01950 [Nocardia huaxiensis]